MVTRAVRKKPAFDQGMVDETFAQWELIRKQEAELSARKGVLRQRLVDVLEQFGESDDKGHLRLPVQNVAGFSGLKYERRVSPHLDEDTATKILTKKKILADAQTTITVLDEGKIEALFYQEKVTEEEYAEMFPASISWAFKPEKS